MKNISLLTAVCFCTFPWSLASMESPHNSPKKVTFKPFGDLYRYNKHPWEKYWEIAKPTEEDMVRWQEEKSDEFDSLLTAMDHVCSALRTHRKCDPLLKAIEAYTQQLEMSRYSRDFAALIKFKLKYTDPNDYQKAPAVKIALENLFGILNWIETEEKL